MSDLVIDALTIVNEDGTSIEDYPVNPLKEKWDKLYPPMRNGRHCSQVLGYRDDGSPIMNYTCVLCNEEKCQYSNGWKVPDDDIGEWELYQKQCFEYNRQHNPSLIEMLKNSDNN